MSARNDGYGKPWILEHAIPIVRSYSGMTIRQLYYRLVAKGFPNTMNHYGRVKSAMTSARWDGKVRFGDFIDEDRSMRGETKYQKTSVDSQFERAIEQVEIWMRAYRKNRWENQDTYLETWIEKNALINVFKDPVNGKSVGLGPCKGYPSLTFLNDAKHRFNSTRKKGIILYYGDYDPSGQDIPRSLGDNLHRMGCNVTIEHMMLHEDQIEDLGLPGVPAKESDSRTASWDGDSCVELDAVDPPILEKMCKKHILEYLDEDSWQELKKQEAEEKKEFINRMKEAVSEMDFETEEEDDDDDEPECYQCGKNFPKDDKVYDDDGDVYCGQGCLDDSGN